MKLRCSRPKGEQIIAQGFSPGRGSKSSPPCKGDRFTIVLQDETTRLLTTYVGRPLCPKRTPRSPLVRRFVLVLVVVLVLESGHAECWSIGVLEYCTNLELHPASAGLGVLSGRLNYLPNPGLKPWAMFCSRFAAKPDSLLGCSLIPFRIFTP